MTTHGPTTDPDAKDISLEEVAALLWLAEDDADGGSEDGPSLLDYSAAIAATAA